VEAIQSDPLKSMPEHAKDMGVVPSTFRSPDADVSAKSLMRLERPLLMPAIKEKHFQRCKGLLNNLKSAQANHVIIFSD
jgi:hypothetical protein